MRLVTGGQGSLIHKVTHKVTPVSVDICGQPEVYTSTGMITTAHNIITSSVRRICEQINVVHVVDVYTKIPSDH